MANFPETSSLFLESHRAQFLASNPISELTAEIPDNLWVPRSVNRRFDNFLQDFEIGQDRLHGGKNTDIFMPLYGERFLYNWEDGQNGQLIEATGLEEMTRINWLIQERILIDEGGLVPQRVVIPDETIPKIDRLLHLTEITRHPAWQSIWLECIANGIWPLMTVTPDQAARNGIRISEDAVYGHDAKSTHLINLALKPRETSILYRRIAEIGLERKRDPSATFFLTLPGEMTGEEDIFAYPGIRNYVTHGSHNPVAEIDETSDGYTYPRLLADLAVLPESYRLEKIQEAYQFLKLHNAYVRDSIDLYVNRNYDYLPPADAELKRRSLSLLVYALKDQAKVIVSLSNFVVRNDCGRNMTLDERSAAVEQFFHGVVRVAGKIQGDYVEAA